MIMSDIILELVDQCLHLMKISLKLKSMPLLGSIMPQEFCMDHSKHADAQKPRLDTAREESEGFSRW